MNQDKELIGLQEKLIAKQVELISNLEHQALLQDKQNSIIHLSWCFVMGVVCLAISCIK